MTFLMLAVGMIAFLIVFVSKDFKSGVKTFGKCILFGVIVDVLIIIFGVVVLIVALV